MRTISAINNLSAQFEQIGQGMKTHRENRTDAEKKCDVRNWIMQSEQKSGTAYFSVNQVANGIGMARNGRLKNMLDEMVEHGTLKRVSTERPGRWPGYEYALSDSTVLFYRRSRPIKVNRRGKQVESLELWS